MKIGITLFATDYAMRPDDLARACEERGFESIWFPEHTHIPASLKTPPPVGGKTPRYLWHLVLFWKKQHQVLHQQRLNHLSFCGADLAQRDSANLGDKRT